MKTRLAAFARSPWADLAGRFLALLVVFAFFAVLVKDGSFYTPRNLENLLRQSTVYATAGLGMTVVIIAAGIDLSVGAMIALAVIVAASVLTWGGSGATGSGGDAAAFLITQHPVLVPLAAIALAVGAATLAGLANGAMVVGLRLVPFIVTLGTMGMYRGLAKGLAHEADIYAPSTDNWIYTIMDPVLTNKHSHGFLLPTGVWVMLAGTVVMTLLLRYTRLGRHIYAVGSNEETARLCGVRVGRTKLLVYTCCGFFCGVAALMQLAYISGTGQPETAMGYELYVIAAVIIGGASFSGGEGSVVGTLIGALLITVLDTGCQQMGWHKWVQEMVIGAIIIIAVALDRWRHRRSQ